MYDFLYYKVMDVMTYGPITVNEHARLIDVESIFEDHDFNGVPVVDEENRLMGMFTKIDLLKAFEFTEDSMIPRYDDIMNQEIRPLITRETQVVSPDTSLPRVLSLMLKTRYKSFTVVEKDRVVGMVAREDIITALRRAARKEVQESRSKGRVKIG